MNVTWAARGNQVNEAALVTAQCHFVGFAALRVSLLKAFSIGFHTVAACMAEGAGSLGTAETAVLSALLPTSGRGSLHPYNISHTFLAPPNHAGYLLGTGETNTDICRKFPASTALTLAEESC